MGFTEFVISASEMLANPLLYVISLVFVLLYFMYKENNAKEGIRNEEKNKIISDVRSDLKETRKQLTKSQENNAKLAKTIKVQMSEHRYAIKQIVSTIEEIRKDIDKVQYDVSIVDSELKDFKTKYEMNNKKGRVTKI